MRGLLPCLFALAFAATQAVMAPSARADASTMDPLLEATLQLKVQTYDRKIAQRIARKRFVIGIVYKAGVRSSEAAANEMRDAFTRVVEKFRIKGIKPTVVTIPFDKAKLLETLVANDVAMLYVTRGLEDGISPIMAAAARLKIPTASGVRQYIAAGCTIAIVVDRRKPKIVVNLEAAEASGMQLEAEVLELAEVVR